MEHIVKANFTMRNSPGAPGVLKTIRKAFAVVECLEAHGPLRLTELANALGLDKATARRLLVSLEAAGYLRRDPETSRYALSLKFFQIGAAVLRGMELRKVAAPFLEELWRAVSEIANLAVLSHGVGLIVEKIGKPEPLRLGVQVGEPFPLHSTGVGKVLLAHAAPEARRLLLAQGPLERFTPHTMTDPKRLEAALAEIRALGYAFDLEETTEGVRCVATPIRDYRGQVVAALSTSSHATRFTRKRMRDVTPLVVEAGLRISEKLGFRPERAVAASPAAGRGPAARPSKPRASGSQAAGPR